jgi:hypothetical protein
VHVIIPLNYQKPEPSPVVPWPIIIRNVAIMVVVFAVICSSVWAYLV